MMHPVSSSKVEGSTLMEAEFPDWFSAYAKPNFEKYLIPLAGVDNLRFLQLGVYTGDASRWLLDNVLTGKDCRLADVDTWKGSDEEVHKEMDFDDVLNVYIEKVKFDDRVSIIKDTTRTYLVKELHSFNLFPKSGKGRFDFIYIDADHTAVGVLMDAELSFPLLKPGGLLAFDDYQWGAHLPASKSPKLGIDLFLERHLGEYEILEQGLQVWLRKL
jgi:predicted O-methyltransferase YrrM